MVMTVRIVIEYEDDKLTIEELNTIVENLKRNLYPKPMEVYFMYDREL